MASLLGRSFPLRLLVHAGVAPEVLDRCFETGIFVEEPGGRARFARKDSRRKIAGGLSWPVRRRYHERIAEALHATRGDRGDAAAHYAAAQNFPAARRAWIGIAREACEARRYAEAVDAFLKALEIWPADAEVVERRQALREGARCAENQGAHDIARRLWHECYNDAVGRHDLDAAIEACRHLADLARRCGDPATTRDHLKTAIELANRRGDAEGIARSRYVLAAFLTDRIRLHAALKEIEAAESAAARCGDRGLHSEILGFRGLILAMLGRASEAREQVDASLEIALENNHVEAVAVAYRRLANLREYAADYPGECDAQIRVITFCRRKELAAEVHTCLSCLSYAFFRTGQWKRALRTAREVLEAPDSDPALHATALLVRGLIATFRGERRRADRMTQEALARVRRENLVDLEFFALWARAVLAEADGRVAEASDLFSGIRLLWEETDDLHDVVPALLSAGSFHADQGQGDRLGECVDIMNRVASRNVTAETRAARQAVEGEAARLKGDLPRAVSLLRDAVANYEAVGVPVEQVLVRHRLSLALWAAGDDDEALRLHRGARAIAEGLGMRLLLERLEKARPAAGAAPESGAGGLTGRQRDVLRLMADGLTNKEIADRLSLSTRTVEMHVARTLERLHCRTRAQAVHKAAELGVD